VAGSFVAAARNREHATGPVGEWCTVDLNGDHAGVVRERILAAAAGHFEAHGFTATPVEAIATDSGVALAEILDYFPRKEDILLELLGEAVRPQLKAVRQIGLERYEPDAALWQLVAMDVANLCRGPHNYGALQLLPEAKGSEFDWYWRRRHQLFRVYSDQIARGFVSGAFVEGEPRTTSELVFGLVESVILARPQFRRRSTTPAVMADAALRICGVADARLRLIAASPPRPD
jgi:AcrR family transcriptional regulator